MHSYLPTQETVYTANLQQGHFVFVSPEITRLTGKQAGEYEMKGLGSLFHHFPIEHRTRLRQWLELVHRGQYAGRPFRETTSLEPHGKGSPLTVVHSIMSSGRSGDAIVGHLQTIGNIGQRLPHLIPKASRGKMINWLRNWRRNQPDTWASDVEVDEASCPVALTCREREVLFLIADGLTAREIGEQLFISESTVITHRKHLLTKYVARNTAELIKLSARHFFF